MAAMAALSSAKNSAAASPLRSNYQERAASASSAASGCNRIGGLATRSARKALLNHFPGNTLNGA